MVRVLFWFALERLVWLPTFLLMELQAILMVKVREAIRIEEWKPKG